MKKSRRTIALVLALTMMFTFVAMSASAATTEVPEIRPRASICPQCGGYGFQYIGTNVDLGEYKLIEHDNGINNCTAGPDTHVHYRIPLVYISRCATCGYTQRTQTGQIYMYCPYGG